MSSDSLSFVKTESVPGQREEMDENRLCEGEIGAGVFHYYLDSDGVTDRLEVKIL